MTKETPRKQQQPVRSAAAYDGRRYVGSVILARDGRYEARDRHGPCRGFPVLQ